MREDFKDIVDKLDKDLFADEEKNEIDYEFLKYNRNEELSIELTFEDWVRILKKLRRKSFIEFITEKSNDVNWSISTIDNKTNFIFSLEGSSIEKSDKKIFNYISSNVFREDEQNNVEFLLNDINEYFDSRIVLSQFEYDLLSTIDENNYKRHFKNFKVFMKMKFKGYFKDVDEKLTIGEILERSFIEED